MVGPKDADGGISQALLWFNLGFQLFMMIGICFILHPGSVGAHPSSSGNSQSLVSWEGTSKLALVVKNLPANAKDSRDSSLIPWLGRSPEGGHGSPFHYFAWRIPWREEPGGLQSVGSKRVGHD